MKCGNYEDMAGFMASVVGPKSIDLSPEKRETIRHIIEALSK